MDLNLLKREHKLIDIFCELVKIPSPSLKEDKVAQKIIEILKSNNIDVKKDSYGNVIAKVKPTDTSKKPLLLSAHMDVVGDSSAVNLSLNEDYIETDKSRTLGADNKAGVAAAILLAIEVNSNKQLKHGGIEIVFTRDEEQSMSGIHNLDMSQIESEYILVLDADKLGQVLVSGASFTKLTLTVETFLGGHSGIDIADADRLNAVKLISEIMSNIPQGVYKKDELGVVTSINAGAVIGGGVESGISKLIESPVESSEFIDFVMKNSMTNIINKKAAAIYSIRSSDKLSEDQLILEINVIAQYYNRKYEGLARFCVETEIHLLPFEKSDDNTIELVAKDAGQNEGVDIKVSSFHAGAETHIYSNNVNKYGKSFKPCLVGIADIYNMHSADEKIDYKSYLKGYEFLREFFHLYNCI